MTAVLPGKFGNKELRPTKRRLSVFEKSSLPTTQGRALILPGDPNTEIEELAAVGYNPCHIFGVEEDRAKFLGLLEYYHDTANIFHDDIFRWMRQVRARGEYTYLHLDFCGHFTREEATGIQGWQHLMAPHSRARVSIFRGRRSPLQFDWEEQMHEDLLLRWCELGYELDTSDPERWVNFYDSFQETLKDTTKLVVALMVLNFFFGVDDFRRYVDECRENGSFLPTVEGNHLVTNIKRWTYNEANSPNYMFTVWADLKPLPADPMRNSTQWTLNELAKVLEALSYHIPTFNPAQM